MSKHPAIIRYNKNRRIAAVKSEKDARHQENQIINMKIRTIF